MTIDPGSSGFLAWKEVLWSINYLQSMHDSAPYLHDGSAATLADVGPIMLRACAAPGEAPPAVSDEETTALVEYLRGL